MLLKLYKERGWLQLKRVWTNGCFDILHPGHIELFKVAKSLGDIVIVGIDSDEKVSLDKGKDRPINCLNDRITMLNSIIYIDKVIPFDSTDELESTIKWIKPHIMVIGSDWKDGSKLPSRRSRPWPAALVRGCVA